MFTPTPSPSPTPSIPTNPLPWGDSPLGGTGGSAGIGGWIADQINSWFAGLVASAIKPLLNLLGATLLATPDVTSSGRVADLWKVCVAMANSSFLILATIGAIVAMSHQTLQTRYAVREVLPRLALAVLLTNASFLLCGKVIEVANALSRALLGQDFDASRAQASIRYLIIPPTQGQIFYNLLALVAVILLILLLLTFIMRATLVLLLVVAAPLALACHALPHTDGIARFWWRCFGGLLIIQVGQSLTLVMAVRIFFNQDGRLLLGIAPTGQLVNLLLALCLLVILVRIPSWVTRRVFADLGGRGFLVTRIVKYALTYKLTSPILSALRLGKGGKSSVGKAAGRAIVGKAIAGSAGGPVGAAASVAAGTAAAAARRGVQAAAPAAGTQAAQPQPRWQAPRRRWTPPDTRAPVAWGAPSSAQAHQRWSNPSQRWTPPDGPTSPVATPPRTPPSASHTAWVPPDHRSAPLPTASSRPSRAARRRGGQDGRGGRS
ncbi:hypothetical protein OHA25_08315 [Nonomuraea sp. NBC_00507]|uniref:conjugal transfer protein TrbL family protein n=1 Tax=Nonomuraea sp. NBC_00507 TaxID=2976002 RepID=UPI002E19FE78